MAVERQPRSDGIRAIAGAFPRAGIRLDVSDPWGNIVSVTSGSKTEYGPGGFEVPAWADATYTLRFLDQVFKVELGQEIVVLTFTEAAEVDQEEDSTRLVTEWMNEDRVQELMQGLRRYGELFSMERQH